MVQELEQRHFYRLLHSMVQGEHTQEERDRAFGVLTWVGDSFPGLNRVMTEPQQRLLNVIWDYYQAFNSAPTRPILEQQVNRLLAPDNVLMLLKEYDGHAPALERYYGTEMPALLDAREKDWERVWASDILTTALRIANGSEKVGPRKEVLAGVLDAFTFAFREAQEGGGLSSLRTIGGDVTKDLAGVRDSYYKTKNRVAEGRFQMRTGLTCLDRVLGGCQPGEFIGLLGFAGSRKSALARTIGYSAACDGFNVLHIPLEESYREVRDLYGILHAHTYRAFDSAEGGVAHKLGISNAQLRNGALTEAQESFLFDVALPDFEKNFKGRILCRQPIAKTWTDIKRIIEMENQQLKREGKTLDLVILDYFALMSTADSKERDTVKAVNNNILDARNFCLSFDNGRGLCLVTPIQGNREGEREARENEGRWTKNGLRAFNEFESSLTICMYIYVDDDMKKLNLVKVGTCKTRYTEDVPPTTVIADPLASGLRNNDGSSKESDLIAAPMEDDLDVMSRDF